MRIVERSTLWTRSAGRTLVGLGHEVLLLEPPGGTADRHEDHVLAFSHWHAGKGSVVLDLGDPAGREYLSRLLASADAFLDGRPGDDGVDLGWVASAAPHVDHVVVTAFGLDGPRAGWAATDLTVAAAGGMLAQVGPPEGPPLSLPQEQAAQLAGLNGAIAVHLGARARRRTGRGQLVDVSAQECVASSLEAGALTWIHEDRVAPRPGDTHPLVPHRLFRAADGFLAGGLGGSPRMWEPLVTWLQEHDAAGDLADERWTDPAERMRAQDHVLGVVQRFAERFPRAEFADEAQRRRLPWAPVERPDDLATNVQLAARGAFTEVVTEDGATARDVGWAFPPADPPALPLVVPARGDDTDRVLATLTSSPSDRTPAPGPEDTRGVEAVGGRGALVGLRVLDLTWVLAGPFATKILADHGAEVIKVESASRRDPTRFAPFMHLSRGDTSDPDTSGYFNNYNRNKRSVALDTRDAAGREVLERLIATCDVVIENFSTGVMERMGFGYDRLRELRPDVIYVSMSGMGHTGPWRSWVAYADTVSAAAGLTQQTGWSEDEVVGVIYGHGDVVAGHAAALSVLDALGHRDRTGEGRHVDLSQMEAVAAHMGTVVLEVELTGHVPAPRGNRHPAYAPQGVYRCLGDDRWLAVSVTDDRAWRAFVTALEAPELADDPRASTREERLRNAAWLDEAIAARTRDLPVLMLVERLQADGVAAAPVQDGRDLVEHDEHLRRRGFYVPVVHPAAGRFLHEGIAVRAAGTPGGVRRPAPRLGADTDAVLADAGFSTDDVAKLRAAELLR